MFEDEAERELAILACTNTNLEIQYATNPDDHWLARGDGELELIAACEEHIAHLHAVQTKALARFAAQRPGKPGQDFSEFTADEVALVAGWTRAVAGLRLNQAHSLTRRLPATLQALHDGRIDLRRAQRLIELTDPLPADTARQVEDTVLPEAAGQNSSQLARAARTAVAELDPDGARDRHEQRKKDRRVELIPAEDAMAQLNAYLPATDATRIYRTLNHYAHTTTPDDPRTIAQRPYPRTTLKCERVPDGRPYARPVSAPRVPPTHPRHHQK